MLWFFCDRTIKNPHPGQVFLVFCVIVDLKKMDVSFKAVGTAGTQGYEQWTVKLDAESKLIESVEAKRWFMEFAKHLRASLQYFYSCLTEN